MSELSHFEALSAKTPRKEPFGILIGTVVMVVVILILNYLSPGAAAHKAEEEKKDEPVMTAPVDDGEEI